MSLELVRNGVEFLRNDGNWWVQSLVVANPPVVCYTRLGFEKYVRHTSSGSAP